MRDIKFRVWNKEAKRILMDVQDIYDGMGEQLDNHGKKIDLYCGEGWYTSSFEAYLDDDNFVLMQYTGLKDKNGKEIYEGDVVKYRNDDGNDYVEEVHFSEGAFFPVAEQFEEDQVDDFEVVGNIYENPELLKKL